MRVCLVYDCLYPHTVGGAERWLRTLGTELAAQGHDVTYLTRKQWSDDDPPQITGVDVVAVSPGGPLYTESGRRTVGPPLRFGLGVFLHLLRHRSRYDAVHSIAFPYFSLIAVKAAAPRMELWVDWFEVWTLDYWRGYLGRIGGRIGWLVQRLCVRLTKRAFVFSRLHARRLREEGLRGEPITLSGLYAADPPAADPRAADPPSPRAPDPPAADARAPDPADPRAADPPAARALDPADPREPLVVFAGRHIPEKRADSVPAAVAAARAKVPGIRAQIFGDGPEHARVLDAISAAGAADFVQAPGFVSADEVDAAFAAAACHVLPSAREGYGLVVIEAAASGTPSVVVAGADNAAAELIEPGVNGYVAPSLDALGDTIARVIEEGAPLRERTARWFAENASKLSAAESAERIAAEYAAASHRE